MKPWRVRTPEPFAVLIGMISSAQMRKAVDGLLAPAPSRLAFWAAAESAGPAIPNLHICRPSA